MHDQSVSLFKDLLLSQTDVICFSAVRRSTLFAQGETANALYFVEEGLVKLTRTNTSGGRLILSLYGPNDVLGEESLLNGMGEYFAEAEALTTATIFKIPWTVIRRVIGTNPDLSEALLRHMLHSRLSFMHKLELLYLQDVETRTMYYLEELAKLVEPNKEEPGHPVPITHLELADLVGATRETISAALSQLERRGLVKLSRRLLTILPQRREELASGASSS